MDLFFLFVPHIGDHKLCILVGKLDSYYCNWHYAYICIFVHSIYYMLYPFYLSEGNVYNYFDYILVKVYPFGILQGLLEWWGLTSFLVSYVQR